MLHLAIHLSKCQTFHDVAMTTAYQAVKNDDAIHLYDRVAVVKADHSLLETFWNDCRVIADNTLLEYRRHPTACQHHSSLTDSPDHTLVSQDDDYHAFLSMPDNWDDKLASDVSTSLHAFFVAHIVERWMAYVWPETFASHASQAASHLEQVRRALEARIRIPSPLIHFTHLKNHEKED